MCVVLFCDVIIIILLYIEELVRILVTLRLHKCLMFHVPPVKRTKSSTMVWLNSSMAFRKLTGGALKVSEEASLSDSAKLMSSIMLLPFLGKMF